MPIRISEGRFFAELMQHFTLKECFKGAWRDAWHSILNRPDLLVLLIVYGLSCCIRIQMQLDEAAGASTMGHVTIRLMCSLVQGATWVGLPVQASRYVLLGPSQAKASRFFDRGFWRYWRVCLVIGLSVGAVALAAAVSLYLVARGLGHRLDHASSLLLIVVTALFAAAVLIYISARLCLLLCHVAIGGSARWRAAWRDTRGHFWSIWGTHFVVALPLSVVLIVCYRLAPPVLRAIGGNSTTWFFGIVPAVGMTVLILVNVSSSAWLYRRYANEIRESTTWERVEPK
jgi:hypothetical protein